MKQTINDDEAEEMRLNMLCWAESGVDYDRAVSLAIFCCRSPHRWLKINALHCFGYIARVYKKLDLEQVLSLIKEARHSTDSEIAGAAYDALEDLETFLPGFTAQTASPT